MLGLSLGRSVLAIAGVLSLVGCNTDEIGAHEGPSGSARFLLESTGSLGNRYKLAKALFEISGAAGSSTVQDESGQRYITVDLPTGDYSVLLHKGWDLQRFTEGKFQSVEARLVSANPASFVIENQQTTDVMFEFDVTGEAIAFGSGRARIGFTVNEGLCGNGVVDSGEECDFADPKALGRCGPDCTGGKVCTADAECASGLCGDAECAWCDDQELFCQSRCGGEQGHCDDNCRYEAQDCEFACPSESPCVAECRGARDECYAVCWLFAPACEICNDNFAACRSRCTTSRNTCLDSCQTAEASCSSTCSSERDRCGSACQDTQASCRSTCNQCVSCAELGRCPNAP